MKAEGRSPAASGVATSYIRTCKEPEENQTRSVERHQSVKNAEDYRWPNTAHSNHMSLSYAVPTL